MKHSHRIESLTYHANFQSDHSGVEVKVEASQKIRFACLIVTYLECLKVYLLVQLLVCWFIFSSSNQARHWTTLRPFSQVKLEVRGVAREWDAVITTSNVWQVCCNSWMTLDFAGKPQRSLFAYPKWKAFWAYKSASWKRQYVSLVIQHIYSIPNRCALIMPDRKFGNVLSK